MRSCQTHGVEKVVVRQVLFKNISIYGFWHTKPRRCVAIKTMKVTQNLISCTIREVKIPPQWKAMDTPRSKLKVIKMALKVFREIAWETQSAELYSIVADETTDVRNIYSACDIYLMCIVGKGYSIRNSTPLLCIYPPIPKTMLYPPYCLLPPYCICATSCIPPTPQPCSPSHLYHPSSIHIANPQLCSGKGSRHSFKPPPHFNLNLH